jgi:TPR repeat protein
MKTKHIIMPILAACGILCSQYEARAEPVQTTEDLFNLGVRHVAEEDHAKAQDCFLKAGEAGDGRGYYALGLLHEKGLGVTKDDEKACAYFQKSAEMGVGRGYFQLGRRCWDGQHVKKDANRVRELYMKAVELGDGMGCVGLGQMSMRLDEPNRTAFLIGKMDLVDFRKAADYFQKAGEVGAGSGYVLLATLHLSGVGRVTMNIDAAIEYAQKAVALGEIFMGHTLLANIYKNTLSQPEKARKHLLLAAKSDMITDGLRSLSTQKK